METPRGAGDAPSFWPHQPRGFLSVVEHRHNLLESHVLSGAVFRQSGL